MGRVLTNNLSLSYVVETALETPATSGWKLLEPNSMGAFGATITTVARTPISKNRQRRKGTVTDLDSSVEFEHDLTMSAFRDFIEGFCFSTAVNSECDIIPSAATASTDDFTVPALSATAAVKIRYSATEFASLIHARGFTNTANNGLHEVNADPATSATAISVTSALADESPTNAQLELAGLRFLDAVTDLTISYSAGLLTIVSAVGSFATAGLTAGQFIHIGSYNTAGARQNALQDSVANDQYGFARIRSVSASTLICDKVDTTLAIASPTIPSTLDILFGKYIRNVAVSSSEYLERSFHFEVEYPNLSQTPGADMYQYAMGNYANTASFNLPLTDKATVGFAFIGTDTENPVESGSRKTGASAAAEPLQTGAFNTSSDIARLRFQEADETGLSTDFKSLTLSMNNNVSPEKVLGQLGAAFINTGNFEIDVEAQLVFTNSAVIDKVRANETCTMDFILRNDDGVIAVDIPSLTLGGGDREFPVNESVLINTTAQAFGDATFGSSIGVSIFPGGLG